MTARTGSARWTAWAVAFAAVAVAVAVVAAWPIYQTPRAALVGAAGGAVGIGIATLGAVLGWRWWLRVLVLAAAYLLLAVPLAVPSSLRSVGEAGRGLLDAITGVVLGWKQLATLEPPLGDYQAVLVPMLVVTLVGGAATASLALSRRPIGAAASATAVGMLVFGLAFGPAAVGAPIVVAGLVLPGARAVFVGLALLLAVVLWLVGRARIARSQMLASAASTDNAALAVAGARGSAAAVRRTLLGVGIVAVALVAGLVAAPLLAAASDRGTVRDAVDPLVVVSRLESPLAGYRAWFAGDALDAELFTISGDLTGIDRVRIATLDVYDGARFSVDAAGAARFTRMPDAAVPAGSGVATVEIGDGYSGVWLPIAGTLRAAPGFSGERGIDLADALYVSPGGATAVVVLDADGAGLRAGDRYQVATTPSPSAEVLATSTGGEVGIDPDRFPELVGWVDAQQLPRTGDSLLTLIERLRERGYLSHARTEDADAAGWIAALQARGRYGFEASLAGHSIARIEALFGAMNDQAEKVGADAPDELLVGAVGDDEQFATAAALVARYLGFSSRVVVGTLLTADAEPASVLPCADGVCTGANVTAWVEVLDDAGAWVPISATPQFELPVSQRTVSEVPPHQPTAPDESSSEVLDPPSSSTADDQESPPAPDAATDWPAALLAVLRVAGVSLLAVVLAALPIIVLAVAKPVRRRRRRAASSPEGAVVGAWDELMDLYTDVGARPPVDAPRQTVATAVRREAAATLATLADAAVFAPHPPSRDVSDAAWRIVDLERSAIGSASSTLERIRIVLTPRSFIRRLAPARTGGAVGRSSLGTRPGTTPADKETR